MFSRKKQPPIKSLIAHGTRIEGNVLFEEGIRIDGDVVGDIRASTEQPSILVISETARVEGAVHADHVIVNMLDYIEAFAKDFPARVDEYETLLTDNRIWKQRTVGIGVKLLKYIIIIA